MSLKGKQFGEFSLKRSGVTKEQLRHCPTASISEWLDAGQKRASLQD